MEAENREKILAEQLAISEETQRAATEKLLEKS